jgi:hypothetical protein
MNVCIIKLSTVNSQLLFKQQNKKIFIHDKRQNLLFQRKSVLNIFLIPRIDIKGKDKQKAIATTVIVYETNSKHVRRQKHVF